MSYSLLVYNELSSACSDYNFMLTFFEISKAHIIYAYLQLTVNPRLVSSETRKTYLKVLPKLF